MSKYTTEVRYICENANNLMESADANSVDKIIANAISNVFDFDFPIFDENYRANLEKKILKHYYTREIGYETVGLWKLKLNTKLNEIMPYYNQLYKSTLLEFNPLWTTNYTREHDEKDGNVIKGKITNENHIKGSNNGTTESHNINENHDNVLNNEKNRYSDTPQGTLDSIEDDTYLTNARIVDNTNKLDNTGRIDVNGIEEWKTTNDSNGTTTNDSSTDGTIYYLEKVSGYTGVNASELLLKYRKTFLNIDMQVITDLEELFMQIW